MAEEKPNKMAFEVDVVKWKLSGRTCLRQPRVEGATELFFLELGAQGDVASRQHPQVALPLRMAR